MALQYPKYSFCTYGTGNLLSGGSPTIVVDANGDATLTLGGASWVTDNIGWGVVVEYNSITSYIDEVTSATSFHLITALGADAASQSSTAVTTIHYDYASMALAEAGFTDSNHTNNADMTSADLQPDLCGYYDDDDNTIDTGSVTFNWSGTQDSTRYVRFYCPDGGTESIYNQRSTSGSYDTNKYVKTTTSGSTCSIQEDYTRFEGIQFANGDSANSRRWMNIGSCEGDIYVDKCIFHGTGGSGTSRDLIRVSSTSGTTNLYIRNSLLYEPGTGSDCKCINMADNNTTCYVYACTLAGSYYGIFEGSGTGVVTPKGNIVFNNTDDFFGTMTSADYNASDDNDAGGSNNVDLNENASGEWTASFTDYANDDYTVKDSSAPIYNVGTDLSGNGVTDDLINVSRPQATTYDMGCFELVAAVVSSFPAWKRINKHYLRR
jgi:hypothetical protein